MRLFVLLFALIFTLFTEVPTSQAKQATIQDQVILIHGFARSGKSMWLIESRLQDLGYQTCTVDYGSMDTSVANLVDDLDKQIKRCQSQADKESKLHFVTHSLGGPLLRAYLAKNPKDNMGRVVMLSPPNKGTPIADLALEMDPALSKKVAGPTASQLHTGKGGWLTQLPVPGYEVGIIGGNFTFNPVSAVLLPGEDDGLVPVSNMKMDGMKDFITVKATHVTIRYSKKAVHQIHSFLRTGTFVH